MQRRTAILAMLGLPFAEKLRASVPSVATQDNFLDDVSRRAVRFFLEQADPATGLVLDRARSWGDRVYGSAANVASIAATGFGLSALAIAADHNWIPETDARDRARRTLRFFADHAENQRGWFYHFMDASTGERVWRCEVSSIDTALLLAGMLTVRERFADPEISALAERIYHRIDFPWMLNGDSNLLSHGWTPEAGFLKSRWDRFSELPLLYLLAIGSPAAPIKPASWYAWQRPSVRYAGFTYSTAPTLFCQQYPQAWLDLRSLRDADPSGIDYFENSAAATRAHRAFCLTMASRFPRSYSENVWGITASDSARGYVAWGEAPSRVTVDGTVVPCAAGGSLMFAPDICVPALMTMRDRFGEKIWGRYGFCDAFNPTTGWVDTDVLGIDQGITLLSAENLRGGRVWRSFMRNPEIPKALELCGFERDYDQKGAVVRRDMLRRFLSAVAK
jgi:hypothetical protein